MELEHVIISVYVRIDEIYQATRFSTLFNGD